LQEINVKATELRPGMAVIMDGKLAVCVQSVHVTPGNLRAFVQAKVRVVADGSTMDKRLRATEELEGAYLDRRDMEYLYSDKNGHVLMDNTTYDQLVVSNEIFGEAGKYFKPNTALVALVHDEKVVSIELPKTVELKVTDTTPQVKGATATNQLKEAVMETGLKTRVPPFIEVGEILRISTEDGSYLARASKDK
jgi:elongation factor P